MSCNLTAGISKGCRDNAGGIVEVYLANYPNDLKFTEVSGVITSITGLTSAFYKFVPNKNSSNWAENIQSSIENGTIGYEQVITLVFSKNDSILRNAIKMLGQANLVAIVRDKNEQYWFLGAQNGLEVTGGGSSSGTLMNDLNGWTITISGTEPQPAFEVSSTLISSLLAT